MLSYLFKVKFINDKYIAEINKRSVLEVSKIFPRKIKKIETSAEFKKNMFKKI